MKHSFRIIIGMLLLAIPLCLNAQVKPTETPTTSQTEADRQLKEADRQEAERQQKAIMEKQADMEKQAAIKPAQNEQTVHKPTVKPKKSAEKPQANPEKPEKPEPKSGFEWPKISGFVQAFYTANMDEQGNLLDNEFKIRRARLSIDGKFGERFSYKLQGDFSSTPALVDAYLKFKACDEFAIQIGQFKTPFSLESPFNPVNLEIYDYGEAITKLVGYKDVCGVGKLGRDIGVMASGSLFAVKKDGKTLYHVVDYSIGVFNGNGANAADNNNRKDIVGRLNIHPGLKDLTLSGSYYNGKYSTDAVDRGTRNRWAAGIQYDNGNLVVRAEYLSGTTGYNTVADTNNVILSEDRFFSRGYYAVAGYNFKLGKEKSQQLMPVLRYEHFTKDVSLAKSGTTFYTVGLSYWPIKYVNVKLNYQLVQTHNLIGDDTYKKAFTNRVVAAVNFKF
jgi:hypothetical protein